MKLSRHLPTLVKQGKIRVIGAYYNLDTGVVTFLNQPAGSR